MTRGDALRLVIEHMHRRTVVERGKRRVGAELCAHHRALGPPTEPIDIAPDVLELRLNRSGNHVRDAVEDDRTGRAQDRRGDILVSNVGYEMRDLLGCIHDSPLSMILRTAFAE